MTSPSWSLVRATILILSLAHCEGPRGERGPRGSQGPTGENCEANAEQDGVLITCGDLDVLLPYGEDGEGCTAESSRDGVTVTCPDGSVTIPNGEDGADGDAGESCTAVEGDETVTITCGDDEVVIPLGPPPVEPTCVVPPGDASDASVPIQSCMDEVGERGGGTVLLGPGEYELRTNHLRFEVGKHDHVRLKGTGPLTVLRLGAGLRRSAILVGSDSDNLTRDCPAYDDDHAVTGVRIEGIRIVGNLGVPADCCPAENEDWQDSVAWLTCETYGTTYTANPNLTRNGITVRCATDVTVADVMIENANSGGVVADHTQGLVVERAHVDRPLVDCFASNFTEGTIVRQVTCDTPGWSGLNGDPATHLRLEHNVVSSSGRLYTCPGKTPWEKAGLYLVNVDDSTVTGNTIIDSTGAGIELHGSDRNILSQNHIENSTKVGIVLDKLGDGCGVGSSNNILSENVIASGDDRPIWAICPSVGNIASTNVCTGHPNDSALVTINSECSSTCPGETDVLQVTAGCDG